MAPSQELSGIQVAIITPFQADGSVDYKGLDQHVNRLIDAGVHGLVPGGSTGEFTVLSQDERKAVLEQVVKSAAGRVPVVAGVGTLSTVDTIDLAKHAAGLKVAALMVVPPFYDALNYEEIKTYMNDIHTASGVDIMYYNIPGASGVTLSPTQLAGLKSVGVKYLKDTSGNGPALTELLFQLGDEITTFNGWDTLTFYGLAAGAKGSIWGATNIIPELSVELWNALAVNNDLKKGREIWAKIFPICKFLESTNYCAAVKTGMELRGWSTGGLRKPFALLNDQLQAEFVVHLQSAGVQTIKK
ncbi:dihydrodipicolinate synthase [Colletotrichum truncatum]|uniref:Dihydrodipicolinate synthase n=1 Tax=Colletotrichum truncatum TaxID=5467 RepID=A0ACC3YBD2_COLTU|nr:dihydrodipicolinate synthase [Colletotrichum truncatum]KAF6781464.1 dihydrodipicolinate synthase [Colletotrichum truncatum]